MLNWAALNQVQILTFALVLLRCSSFILSSAVFNTQSIPPFLKVLFSLSLTTIMYTIATHHSQAMNSHWLNENLTQMAIREVLVGLLIGVLTRVFFFVVSMAGELFSMSMGLSAAQIFNPLTGSQNQILDQFYTWLSLMIFFVIGGHHILITALAQSFELIPITNEKINTSVLFSIVQHFQSLVTMAIQIASPILVAMLISNIAMGILGRTVPQINVMVTSFPLTIMMGLLILILTMPLWTPEMNHVLDDTATELWKVMKAI